MVGVNGREVESCGRRKNRNEGLSVGEGVVRRTWSEYFEDLCNMDTEEQVMVHMCGFGGGRRGSFLGGDAVGRAEMEVRVKKLKNGKEAVRIRLLWR